MGPGSDLHSVEKLLSAFRVTVSSGLGLIVRAGFM